MGIKLSLVFSIITSIFIASSVSPNQYLEIRFPNQHDCELILNEKRIPAIPYLEYQYILVNKSYINKSTIKCTQNESIKDATAYFQQVRIDLNIIDGKIQINEKDLKTQINSLFIFLLSLFVFYFFFLELFKRNSLHRNLCILSMNAILYLCFTPGFFDNDSLPLLINAYLNDKIYQLGVVSFHLSQFATIFINPLKALLIIQLVIITYCMMITHRFIQEVITNKRLHYLLIVLLVLHPLFVFAHFTVNRDGLFAWTLMAQLILLFNYKRLELSDKFILFLLTLINLNLREEFIIIYILGFLFISFKHKLEFKRATFFFTLPILLSLFLNSILGYSKAYKRKIFVQLANYFAISYIFNPDDRINHKADYKFLETHLYKTHKIKKLYQTKVFYSSLIFKEEKIKSLSNEHFQKSIWIHFKLIKRNIKYIIKETFKRVLLTFHSFDKDWMPGLENSFFKKPTKYNEVYLLTYLSQEQPQYSKHWYDWILSASKYSFSILCLPLIIMFIFIKKNKLLQFLATLLAVRTFIIIVSAPSSFYKYHYILNIFEFIAVLFILSKLLPKLKNLIYPT